MSEAPTKKSARPDFLIETSKHSREVRLGQPRYCWLLRLADGRDGRLPRTLARKYTYFRIDSILQDRDCCLFGTSTTATRIPSCKQHGHVFLKQLGVVQVREFRNSWTTSSPCTAGKHIERLKRFFSWCVENGWLEQSPAKPLKSPKVGETDVIPFSEEEIKTILKASEAHEGTSQVHFGATEPYRFPDEPGLYAKLYRSLTQVHQNAYLR
jgi:hypothetical protein